MKTIKHIFTAFLFLTGCQISFAQNAELLESVPATKEEFISTEKRVIATVNWLENTPLDLDADKRQKQNALLIGWLTNSPTVTLEINASVLTFTKKNTQMIVLFMGGWAKYSLENNYSTDAVKCNMAGIRSAMNVYKKGVAIKKDKEMEKLIALDEKGELEKWVVEKLAKK